MPIEQGSQDDAAGAWAEQHPQKYDYKHKGSILNLQGSELKVSGGKKDEDAYPGDSISDDKIANERVTFNERSTPRRGRVNQGFDAHVSPLIFWLYRIGANELVSNDVVSSY